jgi:general secretion pathway protein K
MATQRGVALIVALLVVALAAVLIGGLLDRGELALARTRNQLRENQAQAYALGLEAYAAKVLEQAQGQTDAADSPWALPLPPTPVPGGTISAQMSDLNGRFNLNNLDPTCGATGAWRTKFERLLRALKLDPKLADDVAAWMGTASPLAADDAFYLGQNPPYRAAHRDFMHVSELRLIRGVDGDVYAALAPHVAALPSCTRINVNTASVPVLMTLTDAMTAQMAQAIWQQGHAHFDGLTEMCNAQPPPVRAGCNDATAYDTRSAYFLARGEIVLDGLPFEFTSVIERRTGGRDGGIRVLQRSRGTD